MPTVIKSVLASTFHPQYPLTVSLMRCGGPDEERPDDPPHLELWVQLDPRDPTRLIDENGDDQVLLAVSLSDDEATALWNAWTLARSHP